MRLIDADKLMDSLKGNVLIDVTPELEDTIAQQPTAFDKEKVIEGLQNVTVSDLIKLLDTEGNRRGGATGKERILSIQVNGEFLGYITSAKLDGWGDGLVTDVCLEVETE